MAPVDGDNASLSEFLVPQLDRTTSTSPGGSQGFSQEASMQFSCSVHSDPEAGIIRDGFGGPKANRKALRKINRFMKRRGKKVNFLTVFCGERGAVLFTKTGATSLLGRSYIPVDGEGQYLRLALERGLKRQGCELDFGGIQWLSGERAEVYDKYTMLADAKTDKLQRTLSTPDSRLYTVLSPTGRYVVAAVLKLRVDGTLDAKVLKKVRKLADGLEVYEAWAGSGSFFAKLARAA